MHEAQERMKRTEDNSAFTIHGDFDVSYVVIVVELLTGQSTGILASHSYASYSTTIKIAFIKLK